MGGAIDGFAIYGAGVFAGHKYESCASDGMFLNGNASVGGDNDEKYEDDISVAVTTPECAVGRRYGYVTCFANGNIERIFLYFHYEYVKVNFGTWSFRWALMCVAIGVFVRFGIL